MRRLEGRTAIVTGISGGIGAAVAALFAQEGARIISLDHPDAAARDTDVRTCDVADPTSVEQAFADIGRTKEPVDILVHAAGIAGPRGRLHEIDLVDWQRVQDTNLRGAFLVMRAVVPLMLAHGGGTILPIASVTGLRGMREVSAYSASKAGLVQLCRTAALDYAAHNIRVNAICPGPVDTPMLGRQAPEFLARLSASIPLQRTASPEDVARLALFLASDDAAYVTGQCQVVDGGFLAA